MIFSNMKGLLFVSLIVTAVMKSKCEWDREQQEDVNSDRIKSLAQLAIVELDRISKTEIEYQVTEIKDASTRYGSSEIVKLTLKVCPTLSQSSDQCEVCHVQLIRPIRTDPYQLDAANTHCRPLVPHNNNGNDGNGNNNGINDIGQIISHYRPRVPINGSTMTHCRISYIIPIVVLSQIHKILSLF